MATQEATSKAVNYRAGDRVQWSRDGERRQLESTGTIVRRVGRYRQWMVKLDSGRVVWWWSSDMRKAGK